MRDKKNFSTLGKIDEKFVEEAESYSVSETEKANAKRKKRVFAERILAVAAAAFVVCAGILFFSRFFSGMKSAGGADNMATAPEAGDTVDKSEDGAADISSASGESQVDSEDSDSSDSSSESGTEEDN